jgi:hypothetical protein
MSIISFNVPPYIVYIGYEQKWARNAPLRYTWRHPNFLWVSLPTLTLWQQPIRNSLIHTTTLESTPDAAIFLSSRSWGTRSNAFEKYIIIASSLTASSRESPMSWQTVIIWLSHEYPDPNNVVPRIANHCLSTLVLYILLWPVPFVCTPLSLTSELVGGEWSASRP